MKFQELGTPIVPLNIWNAIEFCVIAWKGVQSETIQNCWKKTKIIPLSQIDFQDDDIVETHTQIELEQESLQLEYLFNNLPFDDPITAIDYVNIDNELVPEETIMKDEDIVTAIKLTHDDNSKEEEEIPVVTLTEALRCAETLFNFLTYPSENFEISTKQISTIRSIRSNILLHKNSSARQSNLEEDINLDSF